MDQAASKGIGDRAIQRIAQVAPSGATPTAQPVVSPVREPAADTAALSNVAASLAGKPPVDADRVAQIKHAIANGTFPILPATIADRLLALRYDWMSNEQA